MANRIPSPDRIHRANCSEDSWFEAQSSKQSFKFTFVKSASDPVLHAFYKKHKIFPFQYLEEINSKFIKQQQEELSSEFKTRLRTLKICPDDTKNSFETSELSKKSTKLHEDFIETQRRLSFAKYRNFQALDLASITPEVNSPQAKSPPSKKILTSDGSERKTQNELKDQFDSLDGIKPRARIFTWLSSLSPSDYYDKAVYDRALKLLETNHQFLYEHQQLPNSAREIIADGSHMFFRQIIDEGSIELLQMSHVSTPTAKLARTKIGNNLFIRKSITYDEPSYSPYEQPSKPNSPHEEAALALQLDNEFILRPIAIEGKDSIWFPFLRNGDLTERYPHQGTALSLDTLQICLDIASALKCMHDLEFIHRDIKLDNILITDQNKARLTDFGLSKSVKALEKESATSGTAHYLAPEELVREEGNKPINQSADIWSFGVMIFEIAAGDHPIEKADLLSTNTLCYRIVTYLTEKEWLLRRTNKFFKTSSDRIKPKLRANYDLALIALLCMEADPAERITIDKLIQELEVIKKKHFNTKSTNWV